MSLRSRSWLGASLIFAAAGISACGNSGSNGSNDGGSDGGSGGVSWALGEQPKLAGQISGWTHGSGYTLQAGIANKVGTIASAPIDASGNFSIVLPPGALVSVYFTQEDFSQGILPGCSGSITSTPPIYNDAYLTLNAVSGGTSLSVVQTATMGTMDTLTVYGYIDRQVDQTGSNTCPTTGKLNYDLHYKKGWNRHLESADFSLGVPTVTIFTGPTPTGIVWVAR